MERTCMPINENMEQKHLNEWELEKFRQFESMVEFGKSYRIDPDRPDFDQYILMLKKRMVIYGDVYIYGNWNKLERVFVREYEIIDYINYWTRKLTAHYKENPPAAEQKIIDFIKPISKNKK